MSQQHKHCKSDLDILFSYKHYDPQEKNKKSEHLQELVIRGQAHHQED